jgi:hypothetical protein
LLLVTFGCESVNFFIFSFFTIINVHIRPFPLPTKINKFSVSLSLKGFVERVA